MAQGTCVSHVQHLHAQLQLMWGKRFTKKGTNLEYNLWKQF